MKTPRLRSEITEAWVAHMLTEFENGINPGSEVTLLSWNIGDGSNKGDGCSADLVKLDAKATVQCKGEGQHEESYDHIIKFQNIEAFSQEMTKRWKIDGNEINIYSNVIPELNKFQAERSDNQFPINIPKLVYSKYTENEHILVMENMKALDYNNKPKMGGLGLEEAKLALEQLARLHAISHAYHKEYDFLKHYPNYQVGEFIEVISYGQEIMIDAAVKFLMMQDDYQDILKKLKAYKPHAAKKMNEIFNKSKKQTHCLNHGDPWNNNILVKQIGDSKEDKIVLIDWEEAHWGTPAYDLNYFLAGATTPELRKEYLDDLLHHYHSHFSIVTTKLGSSVLERGFEQIQAEYTLGSSWRLGKILMFALVLSEESKNCEITKYNTAPGIFKKGVAKLLTPLLMKPSLLKIAQKGEMKTFTKSVLDEMKSNSNHDLNARFLACILEADQNGLFDIQLS